jgi:hypothetical protein
MPTPWAWAVEERVSRASNADSVRSWGIQKRFKTNFVKIIGGDTTVWDFGSQLPQVGSGQRRVVCGATIAPAQTVAYLSCAADEKNF